MTDARLHLQIGTLEDVGERFAAAWKRRRRGANRSLLGRGGAASARLPYQT